MKKKAKPWVIEYKYLDTWRRFSRYETKEQAIAARDSQKRLWPDFEFQIVGPA